MSGQPKFSIVTPSLNQGRFIEQTIRSVIEQEGDFEIEYLIMDGGSSDDSVEIIRKYADFVNRGEYPIRCKRVDIIWKSEKDRGQSDAINKGFDRATGDYFAYLNSDDLYMPGGLSAAAAAFNNHPDADFVYGDGEVIGETGDLRWEWLSRPYNQKVMTSYHFLWNDFANYLLQQAVFWRRSAAARVGSFDSDFHYGMDYEYWVRAGAKGLKLIHFPQKVAQFRMIAGTKSLSGPTVFWSDFLEMIRRFKGPGRMPVYFAYYYMNCAKHCGWDYDEMRRRADDQLGRWSKLNETEQTATRRASTSGLGFACFLIANELQKLERFTEAKVWLRRGLKQTPRGAFRPLGIYPIVKALSGRHVAILLDWVVGKISQRYREIVIDYRYR
jgi:glycosyltransferase involved in cell wall biosynthesis